MRFLGRLGPVPSIEEITPKDVTMSQRYDDLTGEATRGRIEAEYIPRGEEFVIYRNSGMGYLVTAEELEQIKAADRLITWKQGVAEAQSIVDQLLDS
jgi:hypothetical protein